MQSECTRFFRRRSSPSSVVRHFPLSSQGRTCEKNQIFTVFQKQAIFPKFKIFSGKMSARDYFAVVGRRRRRSSVISLFRHRDGPVKKIKFSSFSKTSNISKFKIVMQNECTRFFRRRRSWPSLVVRHFPLSSQGRTCEKKSNFHRISKTSNLSKIQDF